MSVFNDTNQSQNFGIFMPQLEDFEDINFDEIPVKVVPPNGATEDYDNIIGLLFEKVNLNRK